MRRRSRTARDLQSLRRILKSVLKKTDSNLARQGTESLRTVSRPLREYNPFVGLSVTLHYFCHTLLSITRTSPDTYSVCAPPSNHPGNPTLAMWAFVLIFSLLAECGAREYCGDCGDYDSPMCSSQGSIDSCDCWDSSVNQYCLVSCDSCPGPTDVSTDAPTDAPNVDDTTCYSVVWHEWQENSYAGQTFPNTASGEIAAHAAYNVQHTYGGRRAVRLYAPNGGVLEQYGSINGGDRVLSATAEFWAQLDQWQTTSGQSCSKTSDSGSATVHCDYCCCEEYGTAECDPLTCPSLTRIGCVWIRGKFIAAGDAPTTSGSSDNGSYNGGGGGSYNGGGAVEQSSYDAPTDPTDSRFPASACKGSWSKAPIMGNDSCDPTRRYVSVSGSYDPRCSYGGSHDYGQCWCCIPDTKRPTVFPTFAPTETQRQDLDIRRKMRDVVRRTAHLLPKDAAG
jgi:hypothetical protein